MTTMKIGESTENYTNADFSFPDNPRTIDVPIEPNRKFTLVPFGKMHIVNDFEGLNPKIIVLNGVFHGTARRTSYNSLADHVFDANLKKFFITSTKFYYFLGQNIKETLSGDRTNFIDYVASLWTPIPFAMSNTESTYTVTDISGTSETILNDSTVNSTGTFANSGNAPAFVKWVFANQAGSDTITKIEVGDSSTVSGSTRVITWSDSTGLTAGQTLTIYIIKYVTQTGGSKYMKYAYCEKSSAEYGSRSIKGGTTGIPYVTPGQTNQSFVVRINNGGSFGSGNLDITASWRESYLS